MSIVLDKRKISLFSHLLLWNHHSLKLIVFIYSGWQETRFFIFPPIAMKLPQHETDITYLLDVLIFLCQSCILQINCLLKYKSYHSNSNLICQPYIEYLHRSFFSVCITLNTFFVFHSLAQYWFSLQGNWNTKTSSLRACKWFTVARAG